MSNEDFRQNPKSSDTQSPIQPGNSSSRFEETKALEQQAQYNKHYERISPLLSQALLDFKLIAKETGLKERKVRDTLYSRLTTGDMIQLFGHKEGICYICGTRMRGNYTQEPLCLLCIDVIGNKVKELYPPEIKAEAPVPEIAISINEASPAISPIETMPSTEMVPKEEFDAILNEVHRYRDKYGLIDAQQDETPDFEADEPEEDELSSENVFEILHIEEGPDSIEETPNETQAAEQHSSTEPIRHFGFQRLKSRN